MRSSILYECTVDYTVRLSRSDQSYRSNPATIINTSVIHFCRSVWKWGKQQPYHDCWHHKRDGKSELLFQVAVETIQGYLFQFALWLWDQKAWSPKCSLHISICVWLNTIRRPFTSFTSIFLIYSWTYLGCVFHEILLVIWSLGVQCVWTVLNFVVCYCPVGPSLDVKASRRSRFSSSPQPHEVSV